MSGRTKRNRRVLQAAFLALVVWGVFVLRGNAERWCPLGGVEALYGYAREGSMLCSLGVSNLYILGATLLGALLVRRAFCSHACPVGTLSELLRDGAARLGVRAVRVPPGVDRGLMLLKYPVLAAILWFTWRTAELAFRGYDPCYALIGRDGEDITVWAYVIAGAIGAASLFVAVPFCRWLCPLAAVLHPFSRWGLAGVRRDTRRCTDCGSCSRACPMGIDVGSRERVSAARCTACLTCVGSCPTKDGPALSFGPPRALGRAWSQGTLALLLVGTLAAGVAASELWPVPSFVRRRTVAAAAASPATVELAIEGLTCRGKATLLWYYLERDDLHALAGHLELEAWPGPGAARARVHFDGAQADAEAVRRAATEPYYDAAGRRWRASPFVIEGYDPLE